MSKFEKLKAFALEEKQKQSVIGGTIPKIIPPIPPQHQPCDNA